MGRTFASTRRVRLGDVDAEGRLRLDAMARYLQDVATDDVDDAAVADAWVLRRLAVEVTTWPRFRDHVELVTWCAAAGGSAAERRTTLVLGDHPAIETDALWVFVGLDGRPARLEAGFAERYGVALGTRLSTRLRHGAAPAEAPRRRWPLRATDLDVLGHVNNAVHWAAVEDALRGGPRLADRGVAVEMEYRAPLEVDDDPALAVVAADDTFACWLECDGVVRASAEGRFVEGRSPYT